MNDSLKELIREMYDDEATDALVYAALARRTGNLENQRLLLVMSGDEERHRDTWKEYVDGPPKIRMWRVWLLPLLARIFGLVFTINLMERGENDAIAKYAEIGKEVPVAMDILEDEKKHEAYLVGMLKEEKLSYISSMVLGLSDALVELTGALAGFTLALNDNTMIGLAGFITGVAATLSMAASEYLAKKADKGEKHPLKAASYTGCAYLFTVAFLLAPYGVFSSPLVALFFCLVNAALIILGFTFFVSVIRKESFVRGFREMILISGGVALLSFLIGWAARLWLNVDV
ncbi:VIT1/CCC1 transporter family protein [Desulfovibrio sp. OttesenSCG-928-G15]|nr:VIT1/CCC1 transporter family protein [Desulfovibrio sp. OttesenSCG-928-G15]